MEHLSDAHLRQEKRHPVPDTFPRIDVYSIEHSRYEEQRAAHSRTAGSCLPQGASVYAQRRRGSIPELGVVPDGGRTFPSAGCSLTAPLYPVLWRLIRRLMLSPPTNCAGLKSAYDAL